MSQHRSPDSSPLTQITDRIESAEGLDGLAAGIGELSAKLVAEPGRASLLRSGTLGHAVHPVLTDVPLGAWMSAAVLDWTGGDRMAPASQRLVALGNLAAVPTLVTGLAEYSSLGTRARRVASVHAVANDIALGLTVASWAARRSERHGLGRALLAGALAVGGVGAYLGGHLAIGMKAGSHDPTVAGAERAEPVSVTA